MMAFLAAMSVLVSGDVFWTLRSIGTAMEESPENQPVTIVTGNTQKPENESGFGKRTESAADWEASLPSDFTGTRREHAAAIAESQLGYEAVSGYSRYGDWFGNPYGEWNIAFVHFVMHYAGVSGYEIPYGRSCAAWYQNLQNKNLFLTADTGFPERGDLLLTDVNADGTPDRAGVIVSAGNNDAELTVIEGNLEGTVGQTAYAWDDACICGWVSLAEPDADADNTGFAASDHPPEEDAVPSRYFEAVSESGIAVRASADPAAFPDEAIMTVHDLPEEDALQAAEEQLAADMQMLDAVAVDITFCDAEGNELEPAGDAGVQVAMTLPPEQYLQGNVFSLIHVADDGSAEAMPDAEVTAEGADFVAESFSIYVMTSSNQIQGYTPGDSITVYPGEKILVYEDVPEGTDGYFQTHDNWNEQYDYAYITPNVYQPNQAIDVVEPLGNGMERHTATFTALRPGSMTISSPSGDTINVTVEEPKVIVNTTYGSFVINSDNQEIKLNTNNVVEFLYYTYEDLGGYDFGVLGENHLTKLGDMTKTWNDTDRCWVYKQLYQVESTGSSNVVFGRYGDGSSIRGSVRITANDQKDVTVNTALGERSVDRVNEYLENPVVAYMHNVGAESGYIPNHIHNNDAQGNRWRDEQNGQEDMIYIAAYMMYDDIPAEFYYDSADSVTYAVSTFNLTHVSSSNGGNDGERINDILPASSNAVQVVQTTEGDRTHFSCTISQTGFYALTVLKDGVPVRTVYLYGIEPDTEYQYGPYWPNILEHSDMEIADGGKYSFTEVTIEGNRVITVIKEYGADVTHVNQCTLEDADGNPIEKLSAPRADAGTGQPVVFDSDKYVPNNPFEGNTGHTQYEWTSNPYIVNDYNAQHGQPGVEYQYFDGCKVKKVIFDVNLDLIPTGEKTIVSDLNGNIISESAWIDPYNGNDYERRQHIEPRTNIIYEMDQQDIVDALNKCPSHSGFDFTARQHIAFISFKAEKEMTGKALEEGAFTFEVIDKLDNDRVIMTAGNQENGEVRFDNISFDSTGIYQYEMREVIPEDIPPGMHYDDTTYLLNIEITEKEDGLLFATVSGNLPAKFKFHNYLGYELPSTGGIGIVPFIIVGSSLILMACFLLWKTRKKAHNDKIEMKGKEENENE